MRKLPLLMALLLSMPFVGTAQLEGGLTFGLASHQGDLHCRTDDNIKLFDETNPAYGLLLRYKFNELLALRGQFTYLSLTGEDANFSNGGHQRRGYTFRNDMLELAGLLEFDILGKRRYRDGVFHRVLSPYIFAGAGVDFSSPNVDFNEADNDVSMADIRADQAASKLLLALPVGLGLRYNLSEQISIGAEGGLRLPVSDYYDGVSMAASPEFNDLYGIGSAFLHIRFGKMDKDKDGIADKDDACPEVAGLAALQGCPDADADGITDSEDKCPNSAGIALFEGCPDSDADGIQDSEDSCPNTKGLAQFNGCPDSDGDGITDAEDTCPDIAGKLETEGCPDADGDGIRNKRDVCPSEYGPKSTKGCPDTDGDGIADVEDSCPELAGVAELKGCPTDDADRDGVKDADDLCPNTAGIAANKGCPENRVISPAPESIAIENVYFNTNKTDLNAEDKARLDNIAALMQANSDYHLDIVGYTDSDGRMTTNEALSLRRAKICRDYLIKKGIAANRLNPVGLGEANPVGDNATKDGKAQNRRVEFKMRAASTGNSFGLFERGVSTGNYTDNNCNCTTNATSAVFRIPTNKKPRKLRRLGTNPEFGASHHLDASGFFEKLKRRYEVSRKDAKFLDEVFQGMGYTGFKDAKAYMFSEVSIPYGTVGNIGYSKNHKTLYAQLNNSDRDLLAFRISAANGCDLHFMKTCGNHMFFCTK